MIRGVCRRGGGSNSQASAEPNRHGLCRAAKARLPSAVVPIQWGSNGIRKPLVQKITIAMRPVHATPCRMRAVSSSNPGGGGAAAGAGVDYQARVSAWAGVHMLAEQEAEAPFGLQGPVARIACESLGPVDDLVVTTDAECTAYVQVKRTVSLSRSAGSPLASALDQFVRQFLVERAIAEERDDPSDAAQDRFVLAVGAGAPATIQRTLRETLERVRAHPGD